MPPRLPEVQPAPLDRAERALWLAAHADRVAALTRSSLRKVVTAAYRRWLNTLTASGDLAVLNTIPQDWTTVVEEELVDALGQVHYAGIVTAWTTLGKELTHEQMAGWAAVVNESAVSYMEQATNRLIGVGQQVWRDVRSQAVAAIEKGDGTEALKGRLENLTGWSELRADTVARTETNAAYVQGEMAGQRALGADGPIEKVWVAALDDRTREDHAEAHDQCVPMAEKFIVGGIAMDAPFDPSAPPGEVVNCRCTVEYLYAGDTRPDGSIVEDPAAAVMNPLVVE